MKVFLPIDTQQEIVVRPRSNAETVSISFRNELTDTTSTYTNIATTLSDGWLTIPFTHSCSEGDSYEVTITTASGALVWRGKAFVTAQTPQDYKING